VATFKTWLFEEEELDGKINSLLDSEGFILFFKKDDDFFGVSEDGRIVFAKMKNPEDEDLPSGWEDEASFSAQNLTKKMKGEPATHLFKKEDLNSIKVMDREKMFAELKKIAEGLGDEAFKKDPGFRVIDIASLFQREPDEAPNFVRADEE